MRISIICSPNFVSLFSEKLSSDNEYLAAFFFCIISSEIVFGWAEADCATVIIYIFTLQAIIEMSLYIDLTTFNYCPYLYEN